MPIRVPFGINNTIFSVGNDYTLSSNQILLIPFYSFQGGQLNEIEFAIKNITGVTGLNWFVYSLNNDGTPNQTLVSGTIAISTAGWYTITLTSPPTLDARRFYALGLQRQDGTSIAFPILEGLHWQVFRAVPPSTGYLWDGSSMTRTRNQSFWPIMYKIGSTWYGNPFTHMALNTFYGAGNSYVLDEPVPVYGAYIASAQPSEQTYAYNVRLYECGSDFIPTNLIEEVSVIPRPTQDSGSLAQLFAVFSQTYSLQRFSIVAVRTTTDIRSREDYDGYSGNNSRFDRVFSMVRMITTTNGTSWSVRTVSGSPVVYVMMPLIEIGNAGGGGGSPVFIPTHRIIT